MLKTINGHKKKVRLEQNISIGSFHASFHIFHNVSIFEMMTKTKHTSVASHQMSAPMGGSVQ